jgi:TetR/AcrR family transcriptional regulator, transcriptional repressor for nem operon
MKKLSTSDSDSRLRMVKVASDLFHKQGVRATSPDEIIEASRTGKGQFYHYFKSKEGLVHAVLESHLEAIKSGSGRIKYEINSWKDLEKWFHSHIDWQMSFGMTRGCPIGTVANELTEEDELIRQDVSLIIELIKYKVATFFIREKAKGLLRKDADEERLADFCIATLQGAMLVGKIRRNKRPVEMTFREALEHLKYYAISPRQ